MRIGQGWDLHKLENGLELTIGGVIIPHSKGFVAHSDGDVLYHALIDAIFGSCALGDIGSHFPDTDPQYRGINSEILLKKAQEILEKQGYKIINIDSTIIAQEPKLAPHIQKMRANIARALDMDISEVSVKATTEEGLGFSGEKLGIAAHAVCLIESID